MKIFALIGLTVSNVLGGTIQLPTISWNDTKLQQESQRWKQWVLTNDRMNYNDMKHTAEDLARAYAQYQTQVYVNYGKVMQPWAKLQADYFNYITVDGTCNTTAAEKCVYDTYKLPFHSYSRSNYSQMQSCLKNASCQMNIQKLTPAQQEIAYRQFMNDTRYARNNTRVSIQNASEVIQEKLLDAAENHQKRELAIKQHFLSTFRNSTINLGCNSTCYDVCSRYVNARYSQYFTRCLQSSYCSSCFKNVVTINPGNSTLDAYKIVEAEYGDVNQLSYQDYKEITHSLIQYRSNLQ